MKRSAFFLWESIDYSGIGSGYRPMAEIEMESKKNGVYHRLPVKIDTGAFISLFNRSLGDLILPRIEDGKIIEPTCANGGRIKCYLHRVNLKIDFIFLENVLVAFSESPKYPERHLLGFNGIFTGIEEIHFDSIFKQTHFDS